MPGSERIAFLNEHASPIGLLDGEDAGGQHAYVAEVSRDLGRLGFAVDVVTRRAGTDIPQVIAWTPNVRRCPSSRRPGSIPAE